MSKLRKRRPISKGMGFSAFEYDEDALLVMGDFEK